MNTRQSLRLIAAAAAAANGGKQLHLNGNGSYDSDKGKYMYKGLHINNCEYITLLVIDVEN